MKRMILAAATVALLATPVLAATADRQTPITPSNNVASIQPSEATDAAHRPDTKNARSHNGFWQNLGGGPAERQYTAYQNELRAENSN